MANDRLRQLGKRGAGIALIGVGTALLVLPGPGIPLILGGVALLAGDKARAKLEAGGKAVWRRLSRR
jgi:hypothetical protein